MRRSIIPITILFFCDLGCNKQVATNSLTPFGDQVDYPTETGNPAMFINAAATPAVASLLSSRNDEFISSLPAPSDDGDEDINQPVQNLPIPQNVDQPEIENINPDQIKLLTGCTVPRVSLGMQY